MSTTDLAISDIDRGLANLGRSVERAARHSVRFSWLAWGFLGVNLITGVLFYLVLFFFAPLPTTAPASSLGGPVTLPFTYVVPWGAIVTVLVLPIAIVAFAVREILVARHEALRGPPRSARAIPPPPSAAEGGPTERVQRLQSTPTHMKNETAVSFVPIFLGAYLLGAFSLSVVVLSAALGAYAAPVVALGALLASMLAVPLFVAARRWATGYQTLLDQQVREIARGETGPGSRSTRTPG
ncbi:MAG: hypothetical protein WA691_03410 [Thermoplasmata archaeon]